ncbi:hypothetical protein [Curtobacterium sp. KBS0715]|uniref:hypothetical protein n=1 Tax=Curtobacterium sp. KBS0715 TaxID=1179671 RepID=UPI00110F00FB|nr:hypothetical protein [Curtobacterium sp. KBS0715]TSD11615.1 hypothetical protein FFG40_008740 [Curtobacterium sp. KBS0715]
MSEYGISNGAAADYVKKDGRTKQEPVEQWDPYILTRERLAAGIALRGKEIADPRSGFRRFDFETTWIARARVLASGVLDDYEDYVRVDGWHPGRGGAPATITPLALLTGMMLATMANQPQLMVELGSLFYGGLDDDARELLNLPHPSSKPSLMKIENWEQNVGNAFRRFLKTYDPYPTFKEPTTPDEIGRTPTDRYKSKSIEINKKIWDERDLDREQLGMERLDRFTTRFLEMTFYMQPRRVRRAPKRKNIDVAFDGTHVTSPLKKGMTHNEVKLEARIEKERAEAAAGKPRPGPVEPHAGWYVKETEKRLDAAPGKAPQYVKETEYFWGWNATLARRVFLEECDRKSAPQLIMAATLSMPGIGTAEAAAAVLASIVGAGHLPGIADADKEYWANALPERLYKPARKLGWEASTEYRIDNLGPAGGHAGLIFVEGGSYCPAMPSQYKSASKDVLEGKIDEATYNVRIDAREDYAARPKARPDEQGRVPMMCPASGDSPTIICPLKQISQRVSEAKKRKLDEVNPKEDGYPIGDDLPEICRQHSVLFTQDDMPPVQQALRYKSKEWRNFHGYARNLSEGGNSMAKSTKYGSLHDDSRRQVRGFAAAQIFMTFLLAAMNIRMICDFVRKLEREEAREKAGKAPRNVPVQKRRDREFANTYTGTLPGGAPDLELRQQKAAEKAARTAQRATRTVKKRT